MLSLISTCQQPGPALMSTVNPSSILRLRIFNAKTVLSPSILLRHFYVNVSLSAAGFAFQRHFTESSQTISSSYVQLQSMSNSKTTLLMSMSYYCKTTLRTLSSHLSLNILRVIGLHNASQGISNNKTSNHLKTNP